MWTSWHAGLSCNRLQRALELSEHFAQLLPAMKLTKVPILRPRHRLRVHDRLRPADSIYFAGEFITFQRLLWRRRAKSNLTTRINGRPCCHSILRAARGSPVQKIRKGLCGPDLMSRPFPKKLVESIPCGAKVRPSVTVLGDVTLVTRTAQKVPRLEHRFYWPSRFPEE
jgi:hypothetical protein